MEIADLFVINKMDRADSYFAMKDIEDTLAMDDARPFKREVVGTTIKDPATYQSLIALLTKHGDFMRESGKIGEKRFKMGLRWMLEDELRTRVIDPLMKRIPVNSERKNYYDLMETLGQIFSENLNKVLEKEIV